MVLIYIGETRYGLQSALTPIISSTLRINVWGRGYWLYFTDENIAAHKTHCEVMFILPGGSFMKLEAERAHHRLQEKIWVKYSVYRG